MPTDLIFGGVGFIVGIVTLYNMFNNKSIKQATEITLLKSETEHAKTDIRTLNRRMESVEQQSRAIIVMAEQIKNLTGDVKELKDIVKEIVK
ncbi:hypothetical protein QFE98_06950 [Streptococcus uberis]|uniref:DUF7365 family protein n=1 Tax=Streptococcus uberis TaxID=1349 RepID=UPI003892589B